TQPTLVEGVAGGERFAHRGTSAPAHPARLPPALAWQARSSPPWHLLPPRQRIPASLATFSPSCGIRTHRFSVLRITKFGRFYALCGRQKGSENHVAVEVR